MDPINLRSETVQTILTRVPHWMIRWGNALFLVLIMLLLALSWIIKYPDIITSTAIITTTTPPQKIYAKTTGKLAAILTQNEMAVENNQPLAIIENTANFEDVYQLKSITDTININHKSFYFPVDSLPILFLGDIESQYALFESSYLKYQLHKTLKPFSNETLANTQTILELKRQLKSLQFQIQLNKTELNLKKNDLERHRLLYKKNVISTHNFEIKQLEYAQAKRNYKNLELSISQIRESIGIAQKTSRSTTINKTKEDLLLLKTVIHTFNQLKKEIRDWENRYVLKSQLKGYVTFLNYWNKNQNVTQGDLVFTIIPNTNSSFIAKLKTPARNSGKLKKGQPVYIKLENYPDTEFGTIKGEVSKISYIADNDGLYVIDVKLPKKLITSHHKEINFKHEMSGIAEIVTEDLRLTQRFFYHFKELFNRS